ncbi:hypothetical protein NXS08_04655 [Gleimia sp. 6138-11-ORH1]|uniref:HD domain-containing protein n=1 Tax=Gleimia sp. 6138-11-ORH1 TaxID=2973937 RepID=UPI002169EB72|nr:hypothetical protein [Gleimia sp. 6138-11-ORH1]MCS4484767.1 hypothetical protein [Gleimia sp. 6138-11-ORH1]
MQEKFSRRCTPRWLLRSFVDSMLACGATASEDALSIAGEKLLFRWGSPDRVFHDTHYLASVISHIDELADNCHDPNLLQIVAWYVGTVKPVSVYLSAEEFAARIEQCQLYLEESCLGLGIAVAKVERLKELLTLMLCHNPSPHEVDATVLNDADLAVLAGTPQEYKKYRLAIQEENKNLPEVDYLRKRRRYVKSLLQQKNIFKSPVGAQWEVGARQNLEAELANLDSALCSLDPTCESDPDWIENDAFTPAASVSTLIFKRSNVETPAEAELETTSCALPKFVSEDFEELVEDTSSLEFEPTVLDKRANECVKRLSAKELARQASKRNQQETGE